MFPKVSGSKGSKELPATRNLASIKRLEGITLLTPSVVDVDIFGHFVTVSVTKSSSAL